jgi:predicted nuclease of predicted toxin-antitoxin system
MHIYLDEDSIDQRLVQLLRRAGHDVEIPADAGLSGKDDPTQLAYAITSGRTCLTSNHGDFMSLHQLIMAASGHHPGIVVVRKDNDRRRDLTPHGIVQAIANIEAASVQLEDSMHILNLWR